MRKQTGVNMVVSSEGGFAGGNWESTEGRSGAHSISGNHEEKLSRFPKNSCVKLASHEG
jgi:hypothetical protein